MPHQDNYYLTSHSLLLGLGDHIFPHINFSVLGSEETMLLLEPTLYGWSHLVSLRLLWSREGFQPLSYHLSQLSCSHDVWFSRPSDPPDTISRGRLRAFWRHVGVAFSSLPSKEGNLIAQFPSGSAPSFAQCNKKWCQPLLVSHHRHYAACFS